MSTELPHSNLQRLVSFGRSKIICYLIDDILHLVMIGVQIERNRIGISIFESEKLNFNSVPKKSQIYQKLQ